MKLAITADTHLKKRNETPERWNALENILEKLFEKGIKNLIISGDLFDKETHNYSEFDKLCKKKKFENINLHIIPGNHDKGLKKVNFTADNIEIYENPTIKSFSFCVKMEKPSVFKLSNGTSGFCNRLVFPRQISF